MPKYEAIYPDSPHPLIATTADLARREARNAVQIREVAVPPETVLWVGASKISDEEQKPYLDAGFTGMAYSVGFLPGLPGHGAANIAERKALYESGHDLSQSHLTVYLDTAEAGPPLGDWFDDARYRDKVIPAFKQIAAEARANGFKGLGFDNELYFQGDQLKTGWRWNYKTGQSETAVRAKVKQRATEIARAVGDLPVIIYHHTWPGSLSARRQKNPAADARTFVWGDFFDGLAVGGLQFRLIDSHVYKDYACPDDPAGKLREVNNWNDAMANQKETIWPAHRDRWRPFLWLTAGRPGVEWERQRPDEYLAAQISAARAAGRDVYVYAYNLVGGAAQYAAMPL